MIYLRVHLYCRYFWCASIHGQRCHGSDDMGRQWCEDHREPTSCQTKVFWYKGIQNLFSIYLCFVCMHVNALGMIWMSSLITLEIMVDIFGILFNNVFPMLFFCIFCRCIKLMRQWRSNWYQMRLTNPSASYFFCFWFFLL